MDDLPEECLFNIMGRLEFSNLAAIGQSSRRLHQLCEQARCQGLLLHAWRGHAASACSVATGAWKDQLLLSVRMAESPRNISFSTMAIAPAGANRQASLSVADVWRHAMYSADTIGLQGGAPTPLLLHGHVRPRLVPPRGGQSGHAAAAAATHLPPAAAAGAAGFNPALVAPQHHLLLPPGGLGALGVNLAAAQAAAAAQPLLHAAPHFHLHPQQQQHQLLAGADLVPFVSGGGLNSMYVSLLQLTRSARLRSVVLQPPLPLAYTCASAAWPPLGRYKHPLGLPASLMACEALHHAAATTAAGRSVNAGRPVVAVAASGAFPSAFPSDGQPEAAAATLGGIGEGVLALACPTPVLMHLTPGQRVGGGRGVGGVRSGGGGSMRSNLASTPLLESHADAQARCEPVIRFLTLSPTVRRACYLDMSNLGHVTRQQLGSILSRCGGSLKKLAARGSHLTSELLRHISCSQSLVDLTHLDISDSLPEPSSPRSNLMGQASEDASRGDAAHSLPSRSRRGTSQGKPCGPSGCGRCRTEGEGGGEGGEGGGASFSSLAPAERMTDDRGAPTAPSRLVVELQRALLRLQKLKVLHLSGNQLSGWQPPLPVPASQRALHTLDLSGCSGVTPEMLAAILAAWPSLRDLDLTCCKELAANGTGPSKLGSILRAMRGEPPTPPPPPPPPLGGMSGSLPCLPVGKELQHVERSPQASAALRPAPLALGPPSPVPSSDQQGLDAASPASEPQQPETRLPHLKRLAVGWGFDGASLRSMLSHSQHSLVTLEVGAGATLNDRSLAALAEACPLLETVRLTLAAVSDEGISALLWHCNRLHVLSLIQCVGPFSPLMLCAPLGLCSGSSSAQGLAAAAVGTAAAAAPFAVCGGKRPSCCQGRCALRPGRYRLTELQLCGSRISLTNLDVAALIGHPSSSSSHGSSVFSQPPKPLPSPRPPPLPSSWPPLVSSDGKSNLFDASGGGAGCSGQNASGAHRENYAPDFRDADSTHSEADMSNLCASRALILGKGTCLSHLSHLSQAVTDDAPPGNGDASGGDNLVSTRFSSARPGDALVDPVRATAAAAGGLHTLALTGLPLVSDALLWFLGRHHGCTLQHLRMERCGSSPAALRSSAPSSNAPLGGAAAAGGFLMRQEGLQGGSSSNSRGSDVPHCDAVAGTASHAGATSSAAAAAPPAVASSAANASPSSGLGISEAGVRELLRACQGLRSLAVRHCCSLQYSFVDGARDVCPLLEYLALDRCDLLDGLFARPDPYGALQQVQVHCCYTNCVSAVCCQVVSQGMSVSADADVDQQAPSLSMGWPIFSNRLDQDHIQMFDLAAGTSCAVLKAVSGGCR